MDTMMETDQEVDIATDLVHVIRQYHCSLYGLPASNDCALVAETLSQVTDT